MAELPERLREAADAHRPDRARILARVEEAMAAPDGGAAAGSGPDVGPGRERPPAPWVRVAAVTAAVAAAVGLGGLAVGAVTGDASPAPTTAAPGGVSPSAPPPTADSPRGSAGSGSGASRTPAPPAGRTGAGTHRGTPTGGPSGAPASGGSGPSTTPTGSGADTGTGTGAGQGGQRTPQPGGAKAQSNGVAATAAVDGSSNDYWTQSDITLTCDRPLTSLTIELRIARTPGVETTGSYDSVSGQTNVSTTVEGDVLVYRWALNAGQTLAPGTYTFAGQFQHDGGGRDASGDTYTVAASGPAGDSSLSGHY
jgi:hypothetical protein